MRIELGLLRTRVARRILFLFILCAMLPVLVLSLLSYSSVRSQLEEGSRDRLADMAKNASSALIERAQLLEGRARLLLGPLALRVGISDSPSALPLGEAGGTDGFDAALVERGEGRILLFGDMVPPPGLDAEEEAHLGTGAALLKIHRTEERSQQVLLGFDLVEPGGDPTRVWARVDQDFLWSTASGYSTLPTTAGMCILEVDGSPLFCSVPEEARFLAAAELARAVAPDPLRPLSTMVFEWEGGDGGRYFATSRLAFFKPQFGLLGLVVAVSESRSSVLAPMDTFRSAFLGVVILALATVGLLSNLQIRKSMEPLEELQAGTRRLATGEFNSRVSVSSGDEFEELADSFNGMAGKLGAQFAALRTIGEIDRAVLSALDAERIIDTVLVRAADLLPCDRVAVCRLDWLGSREGRLRTSSPGTPPTQEAARVLLRPADLALLGAASTPVHLGEKEEAAGFFGAAVGKDDVSSAVVAALMLPEGLAGYLAAGRREAVEFSDTDRAHFQQVAEQLSIALSNARLLEELERMSWGALTALARAIDASSPWTLGHSERVTSLSVALGRRMGLEEGAIRNLQRGGLVHDIGKIGIPREVLDKAGGLSPEERGTIEAHPEAGVRILEPISAMEPILPIVLYHHESWDGSGYPAGLRGEAIPLEARIIAVADRFDALASDRPYRAGMPLSEAAAAIEAEAGRGLEPAIVSTFLDLLRSGQLPLMAPMLRGGTP